MHSRMANMQDTDQLKRSFQMSDDEKIEGTDSEAPAVDLDSIGEAELLDLYHSGDIDQETAEKHLARIQAAKTAKLYQEMDKDVKKLMGKYGVSEADLNEVTDGENRFSSRKEFIETVKKAADKKKESPEWIAKEFIRLVNIDPQAAVKFRREHKKK